MTAEHDQRYESPEDLEGRTGLSKKFWQERRAKGDGPPYIKLTPKVVLYRPQDVDTWIASRMRRSTFDDRPVTS